MSSEILRLLADTTIATSIALTLIGLLRKPLQLGVGARVAYWLWLLVPAVLLAVLLPTPRALVLTAAAILPGKVSSAFALVASQHAVSSRALLTRLAVTIWSVGACVMLLSLLLRQRSFARNLGVLTPDADGLCRACVSAPMLLGVWRPKVLVPFDFEAHYSPEQRQLIIAHECAHAARHDVAANTLASVALCLHWFNPLMYRALAWLRMDQELACDALVLLTRGDARRHYADALLTTQLASEAAWRLSAGCHWQSIHPLKERVAMLKRPLPTPVRRRAGLAFIAALTGVVTYATWAGQPGPASGPRVLVDLKVRVTNPQAHTLNDYATEYLVASGESLTDKNDGTPLLKAEHFAFGCTPYLADPSGKATDWGEQKARGVPIPGPGQILLECAVQHDGGIVQRPTVLTNDGSPAAIEISETGGPNVYRIEVTATSSAKKAAAAAKRAAALKQAGKLP